MSRINVSEHRKENPATILTYPPPPARSDVPTATVAMGRINLHEQESNLKNLSAVMAPLFAEIAEKHKEAMEVIRNKPKPPALFVLKSKEPEVWEIVDAPLGEKAFEDGFRYDVFY